MTEQEWKEALVKVFVRSLHDPAFRSLCLTDPVKAVFEASGIQLPDGAKIEFWQDPAEKTYSYRLPPVAADDASTTDEEDALIRWATLCTDTPTGAPVN